MQPLFYGTQGIAPFERGLGWCKGFLIWCSERNTRLQRFPVPPADEGW